MSTGKVYHVWSSEMVHCFLTEIRQLWPKFQDGKYTMKMLYEDASAKLCGAGYEVTPYRVEKKWHNLVTTYRNVLNKINMYGDETITRKYDFFEELHDIMSNMNTIRGKSSSAMYGPTTTQHPSPGSPQSGPASPSSSPEPQRKRIKTDDTKQPQIILVPSSHSGKNTHHHRHHHHQRFTQEQIQKKHPPGGYTGGDEEQEARREWREWKRQQEVLSVQREGNRILESIDENLAAIRRSLDFIVEKLSNQ